MKLPSRLALRAGDAAVGQVRVLRVGDAERLEVRAGEVDARAGDLEAEARGQHVVGLAEARRSGRTISRVALDCSSTLWSVAIVELGERGGGGGRGGRGGGGAAATAERIGFSVQGQSRRCDWSERPDVCRLLCRGPAVFSAGGRAARRAARRRADGLGARVAPAGGAAAGARAGRGGRARRAARRGGDAPAPAPRAHARVGGQGDRAPARADAGGGRDDRRGRRGARRRRAAARPSGDWLPDSERVAVVHGPAPYGHTVVAPLLVQGAPDRAPGGVLRAGAAAAAGGHAGGQRGRVAGVSAQVELSFLAAQEERLGAGRAAGAARADLAALHLQRAGGGRELDPHAPGGGARAADRVRRVHPLRVPRQPLLRHARPTSCTTSRSTCGSSRRASATGSTCA